MTFLTLIASDTRTMSKAEFKFHTEFRVRWMECDAQGIVFNGAYLSYLELATAEYWRNLGIGIYHLPRSGFFDLAVVKTIIEFRSPALVDEMVEAYVRVSRIGNSSMDMLMELYRPEPVMLLTTIDAVYVGYDAMTGSSRRVPDEFRGLIDHFEERGEVLPLSRFPALEDAMRRGEAAGPLQHHSSP